MNPLRTRDTLLAGTPVKVRPQGNSMTPLLRSGEEITLHPINTDTRITRGSIVFCKVKRHHYVHLVTAIQGDRFQISNNHGHINGWINRNNIYGILERRTA